MILLFWISHTIASYAVTVYPSCIATSYIYHAKVLCQARVIISVMRRMDGVKGQPGW